MTILLIIIAIALLPQFLTVAWYLLVLFWAIFLERPLAWLGEVWEKTLDVMGYVYDFVFKFKIK